MSKKEQEQAIANWEVVSEFSQHQRSVWMVKFLLSFEDKYEDLFPDLLRQMREIDEKYEGISKYLKLYE